MNWKLILVIFLLQIIGVLNLWSSLHEVDTSGFQLNQKFASQLIWVLIGWVIFFLASLINYKHLIKYSYIIYFLNVLLLILVLFVGESKYGAKRWIDFSMFMVQPSEPMKLSLVFVLTNLLVKLTGNLDIKKLLKPMVLIGIPFLLTVRQPDLGTSMVYVFILIGLLFFVGIQKRLLSFLILLCVVFAPLSWKFGLKDYQKVRVMTFVNPSKDPMGAGYNSNQSKIAVGSGGIYGKGFQKGTQSQLQFLPERHTDFVFSVLSEEHGFVGSVVTILLFLILLVQGIKISFLAPDGAGSIMGIGCVMIVFIHMAINIAMVIGLIPIVGMPLPLLSYGGSNLIPTMMTLGILANISARSKLF